MQVRKERSHSRQGHALPAPQHHPTKEDQTYLGSRTQRSAHSLQHCPSTTCKHALGCLLLGEGGFSRTCCVSASDVGLFDMTATGLLALPLASRVKLIAYAAPATCTLVQQQQPHASRWREGMSMPPCLAGWLPVWLLFKTHRQQATGGHAVAAFLAAVTDIVRRLLCAQAVAPDRHATCRC